MYKPALKEIDTAFIVANNDRAKEKVSWTIKLLKCNYSYNAGKIESS
jgi:hypothetical protein